MNSHCVLLLTLRKTVDLAVADVVIVIGETGLAIADLTPACAAVLLAIERQSRGNGHRHRFAHGARVEFGVHIKGESDGLVTVLTFEARDAVVFLGVDRVDRESVFEEDGIGHFEVLLRRGGFSEAERGLCVSRRILLQKTGDLRVCSGLIGVVRWVVEGVQESVELRRSLKLSFFLPLLVPRR